MPNPDVPSRLRRVVHLSLAQAYDRVKDRLTQEEFAARIEQERATFDGLLDDEALALLVLDELGANDGAFLTLAQLAGRGEATVRVQVERIEAPREFARPGRAPGRLVGVEVSDATGRARLVLWDRDVEKVEDGTLRPGSRLAIVNARVKDDRWGVELHASPWTVLDVEGALDPAKRKLLQDVQDDGSETVEVRPALATLTGRVLELSPTRTFRTDEGGVGFVADLDVETDAGRTRIVLWGEPIRQMRAFLPGARVRLTDLARKPRGAVEEWHTSATTRVERGG